MDAVGGPEAKHRGEAHGWAEHNFVWNNKDAAGSPKRSAGLNSQEGLLGEEQRDGAAMRLLWERV